MAHDLSILNEWIKEDPIELNVASKNAARLPLPDIAFLQLNYQSDFMASVQASWLSPLKVRNAFLTGKKKMVFYDDNNVVEKIKIFDKGIDTTDFTDSEINYTKFLQYRQGDVYSPAIAGTEALKIEIEHLVDCIQTGKKPRTDGNEGLRVVRLLEISDQLARNKKCWTSL
jgi:predicted dehydrogenase